MRRKVEKILSVLLVLALVWGLIPSTVLNAEEATDHIISVDSGDSTYKYVDDQNFVVDLWTHVSAENGTEDSMVLDYTMSVDADKALELNNALVQDESDKINAGYANDGEIEVEVRVALYDDFDSVIYTGASGTYGYSEHDLLGAEKENYLNWKIYNDNPFIEMTSSGSNISVKFKGTAKDIKDYAAEVVGHEYFDAEIIRCYMIVRGATYELSRYGSITDKHSEYLDSHYLEYYDAHMREISVEEYWVTTLDMPYEVLDFPPGEAESDGFYEPVKKEYTWVYRFQKLGEYDETIDRMWGDAFSAGEYETDVFFEEHDEVVYGHVHGEYKGDTDGIFTIRDLLNEENEEFIKSFIGLDADGYGGNSHIELVVMADFTYADGKTTHCEAVAATEMTHIVGPCVHTCEQCSACTADSPCYEGFECVCEVPKQNTICTAVSADIECAIPWIETATVEVNEIDIEASVGSSYVETATASFDANSVEAIFDIGVYDEYGNKAYLGGEDVTITFEVGPELAADVEVGDAALYHINGDGSAEEVPGVLADVVAGTITMTWNQFSPFVLVDLEPEDYYGRDALKAMPNKTALLYAYDAIVNGVENSDATISVYNGVDSISQEEVEMVMDVYVRDHAEHFWLGNAYSLEYNSSTILGIEPTYLLTGAELTVAKAAYDNKVNELLSGLTSSMSEFEKELYLHDQLANMITYVEGPHAHNSYGALVEGKAVCEGYAEALQYLLQKAGIQSFIAEGTSINPSTGNPENHAWNYVCIDGKYYHTDLTWNDTGDMPYHAYFNINDALIQEDHVITPVTYTLPTCNSLASQYFNIKEGKITTPYSATDIGTMLKNNDNKVHVYISEDVARADVADFGAWFSANVNEIAAAAGFYGGGSASTSILGREYVLEFICGTHNYLEKIADEAHLVPGTGENCKEAKQYYYDCANCSSIGTTTWASDEFGAHSFTKELADAAHFVTGTGVNCQDAKEYYHACAYCDAVGTTTWTSTEVGPHSMSAEWTKTATHHFHECTVSGCDYEEDKDTHTANIGNATETEDKVCTVCAYVIEEKLGHLCKNHLTAVTANPAECDAPGNKAYYTCDCGKWYEDDKAIVEITDKGSVVIPKTGHDYKEKLADAAHLVLGTGTNCQSTKEYYYDCANCSSIGTEKWTSTEYGAHSFTEKLADAAHLDPETGVNCQSEKAYYFDCEYCDEKGTTTWNSGNYGDHNVSTAWTTEAEKHFHKCTLCDYKEDEAACSGGTATCQEKAKCATCGTAYGSLAAHNFETAWGYKEEDGHAHRCQTPGCTEMDGFAAHKPNIPNATETEDKVCTVCAYVIEVKTGHICKNNLTAVTANPAECEVAGNKAYYTCTCGKWYADGTALVEITDKDSVVIPKLGHDYTEEIKDATHLRTEAANCQETTTYWYDCSRCDKSAKDDLAATDKWYATEAGSHQVATEWTANKDEHFHKCTVSGCDYVEDKAAHKPNIPNATETEDKVCTVCAYVIEVKTGHLCKNHLTVVTANPAECDAAGNKAYYTCDCGKWYEDDKATVEITDKDSVVIPKLGHDYTEEIKDAAHLRTEAANCQETTTYWYDCSRCDKNAKDDLAATDKWYVVGTGAHSFTEKLADAAHLVPGTGVNCQSEKVYYFDCEYCDEKGTTTWNSGNYGDHNVSAAWTTEAGEHFHKCTVSGCDYEEDRATCSGGTATCQAKAECATCGTAYGSLAAHKYGTTWDYKEADGHAYKCQTPGCTEKASLEAHKPNIPNATETEDKVCTVCAYVIEVATGHLCKNHLTAVTANSASCDVAGNKAYYACTCGEWYEDGTATIKITDKDSVVIPKLGHDYTKEVKDTAHLRAEATNCQEKTSYWYDCSRCGKNAKNDAAVNGWFATEAGSHSFTAQKENDLHLVPGTGVDCQSLKEFYVACEFCDEHGTQTWISTTYGEHTANIPNATQTEEKVCTVCDKVLEEKLPEAPVKPEKPENPEKPDSPQTSDMNQTTFVMFALAVSMSAIVISIFNRKRKTVE